LSAQNIEHSYLLVEFTRCAVRLRRYLLETQMEQSYIEIKFIEDSRWLKSERMMKIISGVYNSGTSYRIDFICPLRVILVSNPPGNLSKEASVRITYHPLNATTDCQCTSRDRIVTCAVGEGSSSSIFYFDFLPTLLDFFPAHCHSLKLYNVNLRDTDDF